MGNQTQDSPAFHWRYTDFDDNTFQIRGRTLLFVLVIFCVILFLTLIYLYARWVWRIRSPSSSIVPRSAHAPSREAAGTRGLDPSEINSLPMILHREAADQGEAECSICLGIFQDGEKVKVLPNCGHCYHSECVDAWLRTHSSCPLCRASLRADSLV